MKLLTRSFTIAVCITMGSLPALFAQGFGTVKSKVTLQRKLPALVHLPGNTFKVKIVGNPSQADLGRDLAALLETELLKNDPHLRAEETSPSVLITCQITDFTHPQRTVTQKPSLGLGKNAPKTQSYIRVTGSLAVSFQAKSASGQTIASNNVTAKYDEEFDSSGNNSSHGVTGSFTGAWKKMRGGSSSEESNPPTESELRAKLLDDAVHQISEYLVNTNETIEVYLAKDKGPLDDGDKEAEAGLWQRALETYETAPSLPKPTDDAYRLYDIGVAYEALAYTAEDEKSAMKFLDEAAINYGKAIDAKPTEKYFLEPQKRIETAIAHYKVLEDQKRAKAAEEAAASKPPVKTAAPETSSASSPAKTSSRSFPAKGLTNAQVVAMVKAGMDDDTIIQAIRASKAASFDLSAGAQRQLTSDGISAPVLAAMKTRASHKTVAAR